MRRPLVALNVLSCIGLVALLAGCEDGPTQTYTVPTTPPPNDGMSQGVSDPTGQGFGTQGGGTNKMEICTGAQKAARWAAMVKEPLKPPRYGAGLDIAGGDMWPGLTIEAAEQINCQSDSDGDQFGDGSAVNSWGDNGEVWVDYSVQNHKIGFMTFWPGYVGALNMTSRDGKDMFSIYINQASTKNGQPYTLDWAFPTNAQFAAEINELYDAMTATYAPGLPSDPACTNSGACITGKFGDIAYIFFPALGNGFWVQSWTAPQPTPSIIYRIDQYLTKTMPFSLANTLFALNQTGPQAFGGNLGTNTTPCTLQLAMTYKDFLANCVNVTTDANQNTTAMNMLLGGIFHNTESWQFDVQGVDLNFKSGSLPMNDILHDGTSPQPTDLATEFDIDQSTLGKILNDRVNNSGTQPKDLHGSGLVYLEYARLVQDTLNTYLPPAQQHQLGAPECLYPAVDPNKLNFPAGCTGFEGFVTAAPQGSPSQANLLPLAAGTFVATHINSAMAVGLKPGHPSSVFCLDPNGDFTNGTGYKMCKDGPGLQGDIFSTSFARIQQVMGGGLVNNLPLEAQDVRFFWKQYVTALVKYFKVAGTANETPDGVHAQTVDYHDIFFDSVGAGQFEIAEYVDRSVTSQGPTDLRVEADVKNGIFNDYDFTRELYRGETAIYTAVTEKQGDVLGTEHSAELTNVFGSPVLANGWQAVQGHSAYECATSLDPVVQAACGGQLVPLEDDFGNGCSTYGPGCTTPRLIRYPGAFAGAATSFTLGQACPIQNVSFCNPIKLTQTFDTIQQAMINMPLFQNPYDQTSAELPPLSILIPWAPKQPGIGFPVALSGTLDKFIETAQLDFSGTTISANVDYDAVIDPKTMQPMTDGSVVFKAVETTDFLGEVFVCQDGPTGDLLGVHMYTPVATILDWLASHTTAYQSCGIIIRYSPYGNFADYITSLTNGVRLNITQGGGFGRVVDVTLFVPGQ